jgi:hypothetical protein
MYHFKQLLDQCRSFMHPLFYFTNHISSIMLPNKHDTSSSPSHTASSSKSVNEIYGGVWYIIQYNMSNSERIDTSRSEIRRDQNFGVGQTAFNRRSDLAEGHVIGLVIG